MFFKDIDSLQTKIVDVLDTVSISTHSTLKDRIAFLAESRSKHLDELKSNIDDLVRERDILQATIESRTELLNKLRKDNEFIERSNEELQQNQHNLNSLQLGNPEDKKTIEDVKLKLKLYKQLTGVRFDFNAPPDVLSGFVKINSEQVLGHPTSFIFNKTERNIEDKIWEKVMEACYTEDKENKQENIK